MCAFTIVHIDHFAYNKALFLMVLIGIICIIKILFSKHDLISPSLFGKGFIFLSLFSVVALTTTVSLIAGNHEAKVVVWPEERGVWANTEEKYNTRDFTLKTSYSYSLLKEFMNRKYHLINTTDLSSLDPTKEDAVFFITPTCPFSPEEILALDNFVRNGGMSYSPETGPGFKVIG